MNCELVASFGTEHFELRWLKTKKTQVLPCAFIVNLLLFNELDGFDGHGFDGDVFERCIATVGLDSCDFVENFETFIELAKNRVAFVLAAVCRMVQEMDVVAMDNVELGTDGVGHHGLCPGKSTAHVGEARIVLVVDGGARAASCVATGTVAVGKVAALDHETRDNAVEGGAVVLALLCKFNEVGCAFANAFREEAELHNAEVCLHDGDSFACLGLIQLIKCHGIISCDVSGSRLQAREARNWTLS